MRRVFFYIVIPVFGVLKFDDEAVGRVTLQTISWKDYRYGGGTYTVSLSTVVLTTSKGLDIWLGGRWMDALLSEG